MRALSSRSNLRLCLHLKRITSLSEHSLLHRRIYGNVFVYFLVTLNKSIVTLFYCYGWRCVFIVMQQSRLFSLLFAELLLLSCNYGILICHTAPSLRLLVPSSPTGTAPVCPHEPLSDTKCNEFAGSTSRWNFIALQSSIHNS
jgi:hypothetical protein